MNMMQAYAPMSRSAGDWYQKEPSWKPRISEADPNASAQCTKPLHYVPEGDRSTWTEAQYTVYKEEKERWRKRVRQWKQSVVKRSWSEAMDAAKVYDMYSRLFKYKIKIRNKMRPLYGYVDGRKDGEEPIKTDTMGRPIRALLGAMPRRVDDAGGKHVVITRKIAKPESAVSTTIETSGAMDVGQSPVVDDPEGKTLELPAFRLQKKKDPLWPRSGRYPIRMTKRISSH